MATVNPLSPAPLPSVTSGGGLAPAWTPSAFMSPADNGWTDETERGVVEFLQQACVDRDYFNARARKYRLIHSGLMISVLLLAPLSALTSVTSLSRPNAEEALILVSFIASSLTTALMVIDQKWNPGRKHADNTHRTNQLKFFIQWIHLEMAVPRHQRINRDEFWKLLLSRYSSIILHYSSAASSFISPSMAGFRPTSPPINSPTSMPFDASFRTGSRPWWDVPLSPDRQTSTKNGDSPLHISPEENSEEPPPPDNGLGQDAI